MLGHSKSILYKFLKFCTTLDLNPSDLIRHSHSAQDISANTKRFSLDEIRALRQQWNSPEKTPILSSLEECTEVIQDWVNSRESRTICTANIQVLVEVHRNRHFAQDLLANIDFITTQSIPVEWALNQIGIRFPKLIGTSELLNALCEYCNSAHKNVFLLGSQQDILEKVQVKINKNFPNLQIVGSRHVLLPTHPTDLVTNDAIVREVNQSGASLVFVSLPHPAQEIWLSRHRKEMKTVLFGVGTAFRNYAGTFRPTPPLFQQLELVWLHQLTQTPREFWHRSLSSLPAFIWLMLKNQLEDMQYRSPTSKSDNVRRVRELLDRIYVPSY